MKKKARVAKSFFLLFILALIIISAGAITFLTKQKDVKLPILAGESCSGSPDDGQGCSNGGNLLNGCNWICNNPPPGIILKPPSCCEILAQTGDPFACCFDARRRCAPQQCASIPEGTAKQRCGQLWEVGGYCNGSSNNTPQSALPPTQPPAPTPFIPAKPTNIPQSPTPLPTPEIIIPTQPSLPNQQQPQAIQPPPRIDFNIQQMGRGSKQNQERAQTRIELPQINFPKLNFSLAKIDPDKVQVEAAKPLQVFEYIFGRIIYYDRRFENFINSSISGINIFR